jgi:3-methylcrotonyl-CoA carboxylase alpha subunit
MSTTPNVLRKVLIANRGEIARRIARSCRRLGLATVAVFSDADEGALFVHEADEAVRIGPAPSRESYLSIEKILAAARLTGADALHPGYGFLSERAELAEACAAAGITFVGPSPQAIRAMGLKREAKRLAAAAGVPTVPGYSGDDQSDATLAAKALEVGFPLLLKASAGGGGKGMRIVRAAGEIEASIAAARREALAAFGDDTLIIERYVSGPRHVEIQILGDTHGNLVHVFERECSIQRRHQKILEESPSPALTPELRAAMGEAAVRVGRALGYSSAGTVEFILGDDGAFYFLEVNTRLQVEHPVTELVTGLDLVAEQLRIARGEPLGYGQDDLVQRGHAIEVRLYAEDPASGFLPQAGRLVDFHVPEDEGVRLDTGVRAGDEVSIHYDPMIAKVVAYGATRAEATRRLVRTLERASVQGLASNRALLVRILEHPAFAAGELDTHFLDRHFAGTLSEPADPARERLAAIAAMMVAHEDHAASREVVSGVPNGFRVNFSVPQTVTYTLGDRSLTLAYRSRGKGRFDVALDAASQGSESRAVRLVSWAAPRLVLEDHDGHRHTLRVVVDEAASAFYVHGLRGSVALVERPRFPEPGAEDVAGGCVAPMPGRIVQVLATEGQAVARGAVLLILEAMKMEHSVVAAVDGVVTRLAVQAGEQVEGGQILAVVEASEPAAG